MDEIRLRLSLSRERHLLMCPQEQVTSCERRSFTCGRGKGISTTWETPYIGMIDATVKYKERKYQMITTLA